MKCPLCGSAEVSLKYRIERFTPPFDIHECRACRFQFRDRAGLDAYSYYDRGYYEGGNEFTYQDERRLEEASRIVWRARMKRLKRRDRSNSDNPSFLDIGCSFGGLMHVAEEFGYTAYGAEVSDFSGGYARERFGKERIYIGSIEDTALPDGKFSAAAMIEVIEHVADPRKALTNIARAMADGGVLLVQTADMDGLQARRAKGMYHYYLPGHLSYFDRHNLNRLLLESGFRRTQFIGGVEFGLLPKLLKSRASFLRFSEYIKWIRIAFYHWMSKITIGPWHFTSSMVMLAWK
jgi:SAM-dependent methyltransferase